MLPQIVTDSEWSIINISHSYLAPNKDSDSKLRCKVVDNVLILSPTIFRFNRAVDDSIRVGELPSEIRDRVPATYLAGFFRQRSKIAYITLTASGISINVDTGDGPGDLYVPSAIIPLNKI